MTWSRGIYCNFCSPTANLTRFDSKWLYCDIYQPLQWMNECCTVFLNTSLWHYFLVSITYSQKSESNVCATGHADFPTWIYQKHTITILMKFQEQYFSCLSLTLIRIFKEAELISVRIGISIDLVKSFMETNCIECCTLCSMNIQVLLEVKCAHIVAAVVNVVENF